MHLCVHVCVRMCVHECVCGHMCQSNVCVRAGVRMYTRTWPNGLERWLGMATGHSRPGSNPTSVKTFRFGTLAIPFTPLCQCLSE